MLIGAIVLDEARLKTPPFTFTVCGVRVVSPSPLVPEPLEARLSVAVPLIAPAVAVLTPTLMLVLSLDPAARLVMEPLLVTAPAL